MFFCSFISASNIFTFSVHTSILQKCFSLLYNYIMLLELLLRLLLLSVFLITDTNIQPCLETEEASTLLPSCSHQVSSLHWCLHVVADCEQVAMLNDGFAQCQQHMQLMMLKAKSKSHAKNEAILNGSTSVFHSISPSFLRLCFSGFFFFFRLKKIWPTCVLNSKKFNARFSCKERQLLLKVDKSYKRPKIIFIFSF